MSESYWKSVIDTGMHVPTDRSLDELTVELVDMLGHPNPRIRDGLAYPLLATWIRGGEYDQLLRGLGNGICPGLTNKLGSRSDDSVLRRSFTALVLAEIIARDNEEMLLAEAPILTWGDLATSWYVREADLRGWIPGKGWSHAVAHGADLLGVLARSRYLGRLELTVLFDVVADRLLTPTGYAWRHGEGDRLAYAVMAMLHRDEVPPSVLEPWLARLGSGTQMPRRRGHGDVEWPTPAAHNTSTFLRALYIQLALGVQGRSDLPRDAELFGQPPANRADLLLGILDQIRAESPWLFQAPVGRRTVSSAR